MTAETENLVLSLLREIRKDMADQRTVLLQSIDRSSRMEIRLEAKMVAFEQRLNNLRDNLKLMIKAELMGRLGHFETILEQRLDALGGRIAHIEARP